MGISSAMIGLTETGGLRGGRGSESLAGRARRGFGRLSAREEVGGVDNATLCAATVDGAKCSGAIQVFGKDGKDDQASVGRHAAASCSYDAIQSRTLASVSGQTRRLSRSWKTNGLSFNANSPKREGFI